MGDYDRINVNVVNNEGGGFAQSKQVTRGTTVGQLVAVEITNNPSNYTIRLNGREVAENHVLQNGDSLVISPLKVRGA